ncbi:trypsin-like serine peptidase [Bacillus cereus]|uniref:trypsin-like serine peptidase n=1 Tax=Bacillus cereus TaxID=1396 RepID=UPI003D64B604
MKQEDKYTALTLDEIFSKRDEPATEPIPPRTDEHQYIFEGTSKIISSGESGESQIKIRAIGDLKPVEPIARISGRLPIEELIQISEKVTTPKAFRPKWLDVMTAPRIRPRLLDINIQEGIKPLISESAGKDWPWSAIGKLFVTRRNQPGWVGSGVLVGPRLLLTASHAMPWGSEDFSIRFVPGYRNGNDPRFGHAYVDEWRGVRNINNVTGLDYVICKLNWRIGERTGWLGSEWHSDEDWYYNDSWISVGYPTSEPNGGERPSIEIPIKVVDIDNDSDGLEIETHKFALGGWSGGPLWGWRGGEPKVVGIESGYEKDGLDPTRTVFAGGQHLVNLVKFGWANWN